VEHHAALPWQQLGVFMAKLEEQQQGGMAARALKFAILTAARTGEVVGARWSEIDLQAALWTVPGERMKAGREHRVPLSDAALAVLREVGQLRMTREADGFVFPGSRAGKSLSSMAMLALLGRMECGFTVHGFRSCFADWGAETGQPSDIVETALAHTLNNKVQAAYQRGDLLERRRKLMAAWAAFCGRPVVGSGGQVVELRAASGAT
jgi:integrase